MRQRVLQRGLVVMIAAAAVLAAGCGGGDETTQPSSPAEAQTNTTPPGTPEQAETYALDVAEQQTGERQSTGCLDVTQVEDGDYADSGGAAEQNAGCVFSAAFAGCLEGQAGKPVGPRPYAKEFPEHGLQRIYLEARKHCTA